MVQDKTVCICIPARYNSVRFPGKPLALIGKTPMVIRVAQNMQTSKFADAIVILTDHEEILTVAKEYGIHCVMTDPSHLSGTERIVEYHKNHKYDIYLNVQGDEPFITASEVDNFIQQSCMTKSEIATVITEINNVEELFDFNVVKCVKDINNFSLYFSRQAVPANRDLPFKDWLRTGQYFRHIGLYLYTDNAIRKISDIRDSMLDKIENLEQLKWLENGMKIYCVIDDLDNFSIDTPGDLEKINKFPMN